MNIDQHLNITQELSKINKQKELDIKFKFKKVYEENSSSFDISPQDIDIVKKIGDEYQIPYEIKNQSFIESILMNCAVPFFLFWIFALGLDILNLNKTFSFGMNPLAYRYICFGLSFFLSTLHLFDLAKEYANNHFVVEININKWKK